MGNSLVDITQESTRNRRRSHKKSSKELHRQRRRMKEIAFWLLLGSIGVALVTAIAIFAGGASG